MGALGWMQGAGMFMQVWGQIEGAMMAKIDQGRNKARQEFAYAEGERLALEASALSQRKAKEDVRQAQLVESHLLANLAASGGGVSDPTAVRLIANAHGVGAYRAAVDIYEGESRARALRIQGVMGQIGTGSNAAGLEIAAVGSAIKGGASLYEKYGMKGPGYTSNPSVNTSVGDFQGDYPGMQTATV